MNKNTGTILEKIKKNSVSCVISAIFFCCIIVVSGCDNSDGDPNPVVPGNNTADSCFFSESNDSGRTWSNPDYFGTLYKKLISGVLVGSTGTYLICGTNSLDQGAVWRSVDQGDTWVQVKTNGDKFNRIIESYYNSSVIFALSSSNGINGKIFRSTDDGITWTELTLSSVYDFVPVSFSERWLASVVDGLRYSDDNGDTWQTAYTTSNNPIYDIQYPPNGSNTAVAVFTGGILLSTDRGENWSNVLAESFQTGARLSIGSDGNGICFDGYLAGNQKQYKTTDFGATWVFNGNFTNYEFNDLLTINQNLIILTTDTGIYVSTDFGSTFTQTSINIKSNDINYVEGEYMFVVGGK